MKIFKFPFVKKNKYKSLFVLLFIVIVYLAYISSAGFCRSKKIFISSYKLGTSQLEDCFSLYHTKNSIKELLRNTPKLYAIASSISNTYIREYTLNYPPNEGDVTRKNNFSDYKIPKKIKRIIHDSNQKKNDQFKNLNNKKYTSWNRSHADNYNSKFLDHKGINSRNINNLKLYWKYSSSKKNDRANNQIAPTPYMLSEKNIQSNWKQNIELNPIFLNGKLIYVNADWKVICLDIETKKVLWEIQSIFPPSRRGILAYEDREEEYLFLPIGNRTYKINAKNGKKITDFGNEGSVNVSTIISPIIDLEDKNLILVNHVNKTLNILDIDSGLLKKMIPIYKPENRNYSGGTPWSGAAYDDENKIVYIPTGNPLPSTYGVKRPGQNIGSSSLVAISIKDQKIIWTFQEVFHDLWDFDLAFPPFIDDIEIGGKIFNIVSLVAKTGNNILLDRFSGKPIFDIDYKATTNSSILGEISSKYQLKINTPERLSNIEYKTDSFNNLPKKYHDEIKNKIKKSQLGEFAPPSFAKDTLLFGLHGGGEWQGGSLNPYDDTIYIPINNVPWKIRPFFYSNESIVKFDKNFKDTHNLYLDKCSSCHKENRNGTVVKRGEKEVKKIPSLVGLTYLEDLNNNFNYIKFRSMHKDIINEKNFEDIKKLFFNWDRQLINNKKMRVSSDGEAWSQFLTSDGTIASNPPWGYIVKQSLKTGKIIWKQPVGFDYNFNPEQIIGTSIFGGTALNSGNILFVTGTYDKMLYALNSESGEILWKFEMDAAGSAPPTLFVHNNKQYIAVVSTGGAYHQYKEKADIIYIFSIDNLIKN